MEDLKEKIGVDAKHTNVYWLNPEQIDGPLRFCGSLSEQNSGEAAASSIEEGNYVKCTHSYRNIGSIITNTQDVTRCALIQMFPTLPKRSLGAPYIGDFF